MNAARVVNGRRGHRDCHLGRGVLRRLHRSLVVGLLVPVDVLDDHDRVVHDDAEHQDEREEDDDVQRDAAEREDR